jgi:2-amino-4-hydroxy-6-hydroxymethyldihydropteridine diphosphokinase
MLEAAIEQIAAIPGLIMVERSSIWTTKPVGGPPQSDYYNAAVAVRTSLPPEQLLGELLAIEARLGRVRSLPNAPRTIDLDLLWVDGVRVCQPGREWPAVVLPHPRLHERAFAMIPLLEVVGDAADPATGRLYADILAEVGTAGVDPVRP